MSPISGDDHNNFNVVFARVYQNAQNASPVKLNLLRVASSAFLRTSLFCTKKDTFTPRKTNNVK